MRGADAPFAVARGASLMGREHRRVGHNSQDAVAVAAAEDRVVAVVCDGCGSEPRSEVGAALGAAFLARFLVHAPLSVDTPSEATRALVDWLGSFLPAAGPEAARHHALFTFLAAVHAPADTVVFGMGDGAYVIDGQCSRLDPGPSNSPRYCGLTLVTGAPPVVDVHHRGPAATITLLTDGFDPYVRAGLERINRLADDALAHPNPFTLQRSLTVLGEDGLLADDATIAVIGAPRWS